MNKNIRWLVFLHTDLEKQQLFKVLDFQSIKEIGYILDINIVKKGVHTPHLFNIGLPVLVIT